MAGGALASSLVVADRPHRAALVLTMPSGLSPPRRGAIPERSPLAPQVWEDAAGAAHAQARTTAAKASHERNSSTPTGVVPCALEHRVGRGLLLSWGTISNSDKLRALVRCCDDGHKSDTSHTG